MTEDPSKTSDDLGYNVDRSQFEESIVLLPRENQSDTGSTHIYESDAFTIKKVLELNGLDCQLVTPKEESGTAVERSVEVGIPDLLFLYVLWRENKDIIRTALEKISGYYIQRATREIEISVRQEDEEGGFRDISFKGHPGDLPKSIMSKIEKELEEREYEHERED